eukprot:457406_1
MNMFVWIIIINGHIDIFLCSTYYCLYQCLYLFHLPYFLLFPVFSSHISYCFQYFLFFHIMFPVLLHFVYNSVPNISCLVTNIANIGHSCSNISANIAYNENNFYYVLSHIAHYILSNIFYI